MTDSPDSPRSAHAGDPVPLVAGGWEPVVRRFEQAWFAGQQPQIGDYLPTEGRDRAQLMLEMVHADLEFRLRGCERTWGNSTGNLFGCRNLE
jgi:hypothetical protein